MNTIYQLWHVLFVINVRCFRKEDLGTNKTIDNHLILPSRARIINACKFVQKVYNIYIFSNEIKISNVPI